MNFIAYIKILPLPALLDPQGKTVTNAMTNLKLTEIKNIRIGKYMKLEIECDSKSIAEEKVKDACEKLLCNKIMEVYEFEIVEII
jgi:phosphoribosylformylglycinamidine synthase PurS subunit